MENVFNEFKLDIEIIPSPGTENKSWEEIEKKIELVKPFVKTIHVDVCDGIFAPNKTFFDPLPFAKYAKDMFLEVHLMTENPLQYLESWKDAGFKRFIGHIEKMPDIPEFVAAGQLIGEVGLALDTNTEVASLTLPFDDVDTLLVMTVKAGYSNQTFIPEMLEKVKQIRQKSLSIPIEVDGGMNDTTIFDARMMGATRFVTTNFVFGSDNPEEQYQKLLHVIK